MGFKTGADATASGIMLAALGTLVERYEPEREGAHPDQGGTDGQFQRVKRAKERMLDERTQVVKGP